MEDKLFSHSMCYPLKIKTIIIIIIIYFRPLSRSLFCLFLSGRFTQVLLYS